MTTNEQRVLGIIWDWGGEASVDIIARGAGISIDYARLLCVSLSKEGYIDFSRSKLCKMKSKGELQITMKKSGSPKKIVISKAPGGFGLDKNKKGRLLIDY